MVKRSAMATKIRLVVPICLMISLVGGWPREVSGGQKTLSGSMTARQDYDSNIYRTKDSQVGEWQLDLAPQVTFAITESQDQFQLSYLPFYSYNYRREMYEIDHVLDLHLERALSARFRFGMADRISAYGLPVREVLSEGSVERKFLRAEPPYQEAVVRLLFSEMVWAGGKFNAEDPAQRALVLSEFRRRYDAAPLTVQGEVDRLLVPIGGGRRQYLTNDFSFHGEYEYGRDSLLRLGCRFNSQNDTSAELGDYSVFEPQISLVHQFNPRWGGVVRYIWSQGHYSRSDDSLDHASYGELHYRPSPRNFLAGSYLFSSTDYGGRQIDFSQQKATVQWRHHFDDSVSGSLAADHMLLRRDYSGDEKGYAVNLGLDKKMKRGTLSLVGLAGMTDGNASGAWRRLRRSWEVNSSLDYEWKEDVRASVHVAYRQLTSWLDPEEVLSDYEGGGGLHYLLGRGVMVSLRYIFSRVDTNSVTVDSYYEHKLMLAVSLSRQFGRW